MKDKKAAAWGALATVLLSIYLPRWHMIRLPRWHMIRLRRRLERLAYLVLEECELYFRTKTVQLPNG